MEYADKTLEEVYKKIILQIKHSDQLLGELNMGALISPVHQSLLSEYADIPEVYQSRRMSHGYLDTMKEGNDDRPKWQSHRFSINWNERQ